MLNCFHLVNNQVQHENEPITASNVTAEVEKLVIASNNNEQQQRACEDDVLQATQAEDLEQSAIVVYSNNPSPLQHQCTSTGSTTHTVEGTKHSGRYVCMYL